MGQLDRAVTLTLEVLTFLADRDDDLGRFLVESGTSPNELMQRAGDPEMLAGVLDFLLNNEQLLLAFAQSHNIDPQLPARLRPLLPGWNPM